IPNTCHLPPATFPILAHKFNLQSSHLLPPNRVFSYGGCLPDKEKLTSIVRDYHLAEDAAQEAFVEAYRSLPELREPAAFGAWFRAVIYKYCDRMTRRKRHS